MLRRLHGAHYRSTRFASAHDAWSDIIITIETKYLPATNHKSSRYVATTCNGHRFVQSTRIELNSDQNHRAVAQALADTMNRKGRLIGGDTKAGMCFVFADSDSVHSLCEAVADIAYNAGCDGLQIPDSRAMMQSFISWAAEFEEKNKGREWDGEYIEEIDAFYAAKAAEHK